ncbi:hypothetical protein R3P38DRAFT_2891902 [Favolaschia claudopus]|uniref:F-box domain-containing protein n=1 Tax=Favolaschia claudopus TaxID=2862362 RepID=A0AAW0CV46_9AGAR
MFTMSSRLARWSLSRARSQHLLQAAESSLTNLPNELLIVILEFLDDKCLHLIAALSNRFFQLSTETLLLRHDIPPALDSVAIKSSAALCALRLGLVFFKGRVSLFRYVVPQPISLSKDLRRLEAVVRRLGGAGRQLCLDFYSNIIERPLGWTIGGLVPRLLHGLCSHAEVGLFIADDGLFTMKSKSVYLWNPYTRDRYTKTTFHDGTRQWAPSIRSIKSLSVTYPLFNGGSPAPQRWCMVVVNSLDLHTLLLNLKLTQLEWAFILANLTLPNLHAVGIYAECISSTASTLFLNRHPITQLTYMSPKALKPLYPTTKVLTLPRLTHLTALGHYVCHIFPSPTSFPSSSLLFPILTSIELFPDSDLDRALELLSTHAPLTQLALWAILDLSASSPIFSLVFPTLSALTLNKSPALVSSPRFPGILAVMFPALQRVEMNYCFADARGRRGNAGSSSVTNEARHEVWRGKRRCVDRLAAENAGLVVVMVDREFFAPR